MTANNQHGPEALRFQGSATVGPTDERLRVLLRDYRYAAYDVGARGKNHGRGEALEAAEAALVAYIEELESILTETQEHHGDPNVSC